MEGQAGECMGSLSESLELLQNRIEAAASLFERTAALLEEREAQRSGEVQKIVAAVETHQASSRETELEKELESAEQQIAELRAQLEAKAETPAASARKTIPASTVQLLAKQGISSLESLEAGALDGALSGLSLEQRIAVKAQLLRAGVLA